MPADSRTPASPSTLFVYGSLRRGGYNHTRWRLDEHARFLGVTTLIGARLFDLGRYPCMVLSPRPDDRVVGECYAIRDPRIVDGIRAMEEAAAYRTIEVETEAGAAIAFVFDQPPAGARVIPSGDWLLTAQGGRNVDP